jgi:hypothetical protein
MISNYHLGELPDGYQIYAERLEVAGLGHRRSDATSFVSGKEHSLELRRDPGNKHDKNAIEVIGCWKGLFRSKRRAIGYVPREVAAAIAEIEASSKCCSN